jgi:hypothetical protein
MNSAQFGLNWTEPDAHGLSFVYAGKITFSRSRRMPSLTLICPEFIWWGVTNGGDIFSITLNVIKVDANSKKSRRRILLTFSDGGKADNSNYHLGLN